MRKSLYLICVLATASASWAQSNTAAWANLNAIPAGAKIQLLATGAGETFRQIRQCL